MPYKNIEDKKAYLERNKERINNYSKEYYKNNKEYFLKYGKNNRQYLNEKSKEWRDNNKEKNCEYKKEYSKNNKEKIKETAIKYKETRKLKDKLKPRNIKLFENAKRRAKDNNIKFEILLNDIIIPEYCPVFPWIRLNFDNDVISDDSPTIDKIIPEFGYIKDNIKVISARANRIKNDGSIKEHNLIIEYITKSTINTGNITEI